MNFAPEVLDLYCNNVRYSIGPVLTVFLEIYQMVRRLRIKCPPAEVSSRRRQLCLVYVLSSLSIGSYLANLYLAEGLILRDGVWPLAIAIQTRKTFRICYKIFLVKRPQATSPKFLPTDKFPTFDLEVCARLLSLDLRTSGDHPPGPRGEGWGG